MKIKLLFRVFLALLILCGAVAIVANRSDSSRQTGQESGTVLAAERLPASAGAVAGSKSSSSLKVIAYYFHVTVRCTTCRTIESYSKEAIDRGFSEELRNGLIEWRPVNVQLLENRHFIQDYRLFTRSLVLVKVRDGKPVEWRNLEKVWDLVGERNAFLRYVRANVATYLGDK